MEERRKDYPGISERLAIIETMQQKDLDTAEEWRGRFCKKIDKVSEILSEIPCKTREEVCSTKFKGFTFQLRFIWGIVSGMLIALLLVVATNVAIMNELRKDISYIKIHSYGVQDYENSLK